MERVQVDGLGIQQPLQEEPVESGDRYDGETATLLGVGDDALQPQLVQLPNAAIELLQALAQLGTALAALEDQVQDQTAQLRTLMQRLGEETPGRFVAFGDRRQLENLPHGAARDLFYDVLG